MSRVQRTGVELLPRHLEATYGVEVRRVEELDLGVFRVDVADAARSIAATRETAAAIADRAYRLQGRRDVSSP